MDTQNARRRIADLIPLVEDVPTEGRAQIAAARADVDTLWRALVAAYRTAHAAVGCPTHFVTRTSCTMLCGSDSAAGRWSPPSVHWQHPVVVAFFAARTAWSDAWDRVRKAERVARPELVAASLARAGDGPTYAAGSWVTISAGRDLVLPSGLWACYHEVTESPRGGESGWVVGRLSEPLQVGADGTYQSLLGRHHVRATSVPSSVRGALLVRAEGWTEASPRNGPSFVGRLGGGGSHGRMTECQGDLTVAEDLGLAA